MQPKPPSFVVVDGRKMAYDEVCPPEPKGTVLLLTGLASKRLGWVRQLEVFGREYRTIALDHRDTGDSDPVTQPYAVADQADDAAGALRALGVEHAAIVGISMGGFVALELALHHPALANRLVLVSTSAGGRTHVPAARSLTWHYLKPWNVWGEIGKRAKRSYAVIMAPGYCKAHPDEWDRIATVARYRPQSRASYRRQWRACQIHDVAERLGALNVPTLVIHGDYDPLVPIANGRYLAAHIPGAQMIEYRDTGHIPIVERAADFNRDVLAFLAE
ncbi:MAG: alpha/beta fold hydrolase [Ktedonobacterales bacterium]